MENELLKNIKYLITLLKSFVNLVKILLVVEIIKYITIFFK